MKLTEDQYNLLKIFPTDKSYLSHKQIEDATNKTWGYNKLIDVCDELYNAEFLNGSMQTSGLRITDEGIEAKKVYEKTTLREKEIADLNYKKLQYDFRNAKRVYKSYWWTFGIAVAAFLISLVLLIIKLRE